VIAGLPVAGGSSSVGLADFPCFPCRAAFEPSRFRWHFGQYPDLRSRVPHVGHTAGDSSGFSISFAFDGMK
jgi:hypothetical protein